ncbi:MAG: pilus assembly protein, partial [Schwartzia sp.]|nr:pilus assembly protein [Schwartzia sp. (in: firmicutes)]
MMGTKALKKHWKQKGGVFVLTALALPFFLACVGLAVDVGNLYIHKSRLQNATDAAALKG